MGDDDRARVERRQTAEVRLVALDRDYRDAASDERG